MLIGHGVVLTGLMLSATSRSETETRTMLPAMTRLRRWTLIAASLLALVPLALIMLTALLALIFGCEVNEAAPQACNVLGFDIGALLGGLLALGWLGLLTIPALLYLAPIWLAAEAVAWLVRRRRHRRSFAVQQAYMPDPA